MEKGGETMVGEPLDSQEKRTLTLPNSLPCYANLCFRLNRFTPKNRLYLQNRKMNPSALFAAQYAEAIKLRKGVDQFSSSMKI